VLIHNIDMLERVDLIVADELHLLSDPDRGPALLSVLENCLLHLSVDRIIDPSAGRRFSHTVSGCAILRVCRRPVVRRGVM
jgi:hypothetical protein